MARDPRVSLRHAPREPDRLRPGADDLRRRPRPVRVPRQRPRARRRPAEASVRARSTSSGSRICRCSGPSSSTSPRSSTRRGRSRRRRLLPGAHALGAERARRRRIARRGRRDGDQRHALPLRARARSAARWRASAGPATASRSRRAGRRGDSLVGGAGWIAIALVIFAFWRAGAVPRRRLPVRRALGRCPFALQARLRRDRCSTPEFLNALPYVRRSSSSCHLHRLGQAAPRSARGSRDSLCAGGALTSSRWTS